MSSGRITPQEDDTAAALLASIDGEQGRLRDLLAGKDQSVLATRPPSGKWSVVENVRHLLFAEQLHLGRFVPGGREWSALGLPTDGMRHSKQLRLVGSTPTTDVDEVFRAWREVHALIGQLAEDDSETVRKELVINLRHLRTHIKVIERLLRAEEREARGLQPRRV